MLIAGVMGTRLTRYTRGDDIAGMSFRYPCLESFQNKHCELYT